MAFFIGVIVAFLLPKRVDCGYPDGQCSQIVGREQCTPYEVEPWGFYLIEKAAGRDVGFAYSHDDGCR